MSVITPAFNAAPWIAESIQSVLNQTHADLELIVVNDGSTDQTAEIVSRFDDKRIHYISQNNRGLAAARNRGLKHATGQYVGFLDADDLWNSTMLESTVEYLTQFEHLAIVRTGYTLIGPSGENLTSRPHWGPWTHDVLENLIINNVFVPHAALVRKKCLDAVGFFDESLRANEDWDLWLRLAASKAQFGFIDRPLAQYRRHANNMTLDYDRMRSSAIAVLDKTFGQKEIAERIGHLRSRAYTNVLMRSSIEALRNDLLGLALRDFALAADMDLRVTTEVSYYYQVACVDLGATGNLGLQSIDLARGISILKEIAQLIDSPGMSKAGWIDRARAKAAMHKALGMVHFSRGLDMGAAAANFGRSLRNGPFDAAVWVWLVRAFLGKQRILRIKEILGRPVVANVREDLSTSSE